MLIGNKFLHYLTGAAFNADLEAGNIQAGSIAFIKDLSAIWSHGKYFYCSEDKFSDVVDSITARLDVIEGDEETEGSILYAIKQAGAEVEALKELVGT